MASEFTGNSTVLTVVQAVVKENTKALKYWSFVRVIYRWPVDSPHKGPVKKKAFPLHGIIFARLLDRVILNTCLAELTLWITKSCLHFLSFLDTEIAQIVNTPTQPLAGDTFILHIQNNGCWWPGGARSQLTPSMRYALFVWPIESTRQNTWLRFMIWFSYEFKTPRA